MLNLTYMLLAQVVPGWFAVLYSRRTSAGAVGAGTVTGIVVAVALYALAPDVGGINTGLVSLVVNLLVTFGGSALWPGTQRDPVAFNRADSSPARDPEAVEAT